MLIFLTAGESHGKGVFAFLQGIPANLKVDKDFINNELRRRQRGYGRGGRQKIEKDKVEFLAGVREGKTLPGPILMAVWNKDFENWKDIMSPFCKVPNDKRVTRPRPGHADLVGALKYNQKDIRNILERASARETAGRVLGGSICKLFLKEVDINIYSYVLQIGELNILKILKALLNSKDINSKYENVKKLFKKIDKKTLEKYIQNTFNLSLEEFIEKFEKIPPEKKHLEAEKSEFRLPIFLKDIENLYKAYIDTLKENGETIGGYFEVVISNLPIGLGSHIQWKERLNAKLAYHIMSIQAFKGFEIGLGKDFAFLPGSQAMDSIYYDHQEGFYRKTNYSGGLEGGITTGENLTFRAVIKPIPTLLKPLDSVDILTKEAQKAIYERSDVCVLPAASVVAEHMAAICLAQELLSFVPSDNIEEFKLFYNMKKERLKKGKFLD